jgi:hypothetical protein
MEAYNCPRRRQVFRLSLYLPSKVIFAIEHVVPLPSLIDRLGPSSETCGDTVPLWSTLQCHQGGLATRATQRPAYSRLPHLCPCDVPASEPVERIAEEAPQGRQ